MSQDTVLTVHSDERGGAGALYGKEAICGFYTKLFHDYRQIVPEIFAVIIRIHSTTRIAT